MLTLTPSGKRSDHVVSMFQKRHKTFSTPSVNCESRYVKISVNDLILQYFACVHDSVCVCVCVCMSQGMINFKSGA